METKQGLEKCLTEFLNLSYILEESNIDKHYKRVIMDLDPSYWDDDHKGTFGTDTNLLFRLTGNRWITYLYNEAVGLEKMRGFISTASINRNSICQG